MSIQGKLNRFKSHIVRQDTMKEEKKEEYSDGIPFLEEWQEFQTIPFYFDNNYSLIREVEYPLDYKHGLYTFYELRDVINEWKNRGYRHPLASIENKEDDLIFFDTETTGLGTGTGNMIFLLGYARIKDDSVVVKQHFLPAPGNEVPLYQGFLSDIGAFEAMRLTTYNGKAFDWPQVKTRHTMIRDLVPKLPSFGHFDLLHAARRMWKHDLPSVRLSIVEKEILQVQRNGDVPGYLAPMLYFDFLKDPNPQGLKGIFTHNEIDVLTLITLYIHLSKLLLGILPVTSPREKLEVARWYEYTGNYETAIKFYEKANDMEFKQQSLYSLAMLYKKQKNYSYAVKLLEEALQTDAYDEVILQELAKAYEHHIKDLEKAHDYAQKTYDTYVVNNNRLGYDNDRKKEHLKRLERLEHKLKRKK